MVVTMSVLTLQEAFGQISSHELKPGGVDVLVTEENKHEYIDLMLRWRLDRGVAKQMESFKKGFCEVMPVNLLYNFDAQELEFLTAGTLEIDVDDWREHTEYRNGTYVYALTLLKAGFRYTVQIMCTYCFKFQCVRIACKGPC